ncbi:MAG: pseudouridine synthase [Lachnospiraceae bacterium]|nr:pseudouridine synthase [Lachnospiraceae bacterium]
MREYGAGNGRGNSKETYTRAKVEISEPIRINKFLSEAGFCSRREADRMIESGKVTVDGVPAEMGTKVLPGQRVCVNGKPVRMEAEEILLVVNKPIGIVCTTAEFDKDNIVDFLKFPKRIYPIGRLDKDSSGLILMTNQGELVNKILRGGNHHEKEYMVRVNRPVTPEFVAAMEAGVVLDDGVKTLPCRVEKTGGYSFKIILMQGLNRQIRRMCEALDYRVTNLKRVRVMNIELGDLRVGSYRKVTPEEYAELKRRLENSTDLSFAEAKEQGLVREPVMPVRMSVQEPKTVTEKKKSTSENITRNEAANKSVIKRGEIKKTAGKNIVFRRPEK